MFRAVTYLRNGGESVYFEDENFKNVYKAALYSIKHDEEIWTVHIFSKWHSKYKLTASLIATPVTSEIRDIFIKRPKDKRFMFWGSCFTKKIA